MSKKELLPEERKVKFSVTIDPTIFNKLNELVSNKSKYVEELIRKDLKKR